MRADVLLITDPALPNLLETLRSLVRQAPRDRIAIQLRDKVGGAPELLALARALRDPTRTAGVTLLVNGHAEVAKLADADGVHLPELGLDVASARAVVGPRAIVGASCHDVPGLARREREGADYVTLSPFAAVPGKGSALGSAAFAALVAHTHLPVYALGGLDAHNAAQALGAGARGIAVMRSVWSAPDPNAALRSLLAATAERAENPARKEGSRPEALE